MPLIYRWVWLFFSGFCLVFSYIFPPEDSLPLFVTALPTMGPAWTLCQPHAVPLGTKTWQESGSHGQISLLVSWLPCKEAEQLPKASPASPSRCSANAGSACSDLWRLGLANNVLAEQLYWLQYEKFTAAAAKIRLGKKKIFHVDTDRREILSV